MERKKATELHDVPVIKRRRIKSIGSSLSFRAGDHRNLYAYRGIQRQIEKCWRIVRDLVEKLLTVSDYS